MAEDRPGIPAELKRAVLLEAGHRCAIPPCRHPTTELAHIEPWEKVKEHKFENLIALCPNCHTRFDRGEIDRKSMLAYKRNLPIVAGRYNQLELRMLAELGGGCDISIFVPGGSQFFFSLAVQDGLIEYRAVDGQMTRVQGLGGLPVQVEALAYCRLTQAGREFADKWLKGHQLEPES